MPDGEADLSSPSGWSADRAVTQLYSEHYRALVRLAELLVRDTPTAEEVVQDAFIAMHGGRQRLRDQEKALAYLRQAVVNRSRSVLRHRTVLDKNLQKAPPDMPSAEPGFPRSAGAARCQSRAARPARPAARGDRAAVFGGSVRGGDRCRDADQPRRREEPHRPRDVRAPGN